PPRTLLCRLPRGGAGMPRRPPPGALSGAPPRRRSGPGRGVLPSSAEVAPPRAPTSPAERFGPGGPLPPPSKNSPVRRSRPPRRARGAPPPPRSRAPLAPLLLAPRTGGDQSPQPRGDILTDQLGGHSHGTATARFASFWRSGSGPQVADVVAATPIR